MRRILTNGFFFIAISLTAYAQSTVKLSGTVVDNDSNEPLEFASISLKRRLIGTVTNGEGRFDLTTQSDFSHDTVMISFVGYKPYMAIAGVLSASRNNVIRLKPTPLRLDEVVITGKTPIASDILKRAFASVESNFPTESYQYAAFVREIWSENGKAVSLLEGVVGIYDDGYSAGKKKSVKIREKVDLKVVRSSMNYMNAAFKSAVGKYNSLNGVLRWNQVKYPHPDITGNLSSKQVVLENVVSANDRILWVVSFISRFASNDLFERKDTYYIDDETFAIKKFMSVEYGRKGKYRSPMWSLDSVHFYQAKEVKSAYDFEEHNGKMYLKYFTEIGTYDVTNSTTNLIEYEMEGETMVVVTSIIDRGGKASDTMDHKASLAFQTTSPYDESFWNNYDQVNLVPLTGKQIKDLESKESLTRQFGKSGEAKSKK